MAAQITPSKQVCCHILWKNLTDTFRLLRISRISRCNHQSRSQSSHQKTKRMPHQQISSRTKLPSPQLFLQPSPQRSKHLKLKNHFYERIQTDSSCSHCSKSLHLSGMACRGLTRSGYMSWRPDLFPCSHVLPRPVSTHPTTHAD